VSFKGCATGLFPTCAALRPRVYRAPSRIAKTQAHAETLDAASARAGRFYPLLVGRGNSKIGEPARLGRFQSFVIQLLRDDEV
jgi:hypothetical protein